MFEFDWATPAAYAEIVSFLNQNGLPVADLDPERAALLLVRKEGALIGAIGLEPVGEFGLLRSMAVAPEFRGQGLARQLFERLLAEGRRRGFRILYGLTTTADAVLARFGMQLVDRAQVPLPIRETAQFSSLCPANTRVYLLVIEEVGHNSPGN